MADDHSTSGIARRAENGLGIMEPESDDHSIASDARRADNSA